MLLERDALFSAAMPESARARSIVRSCGAVLALSLTLSGRTAAKEPEKDPRARRGYVHPAKRVQHTAVAVGPGVIVHGAGHFAVGEPRVGRKLLTAEGVGLGATVGGLAGLALTGASKYTVAPFALVSIAGVGLIASSWLADVHGTALRSDERGSPANQVVSFETQAGHRYVHDPQFRYRHFLVQRLDTRLSRLHLGASAWSALDDANSRLGATAGVRLAGPLPSRPGLDGSFVDVETAFVRHDYASDGFESRSVELALDGRLDLSRWEPALHGSFVEGGVGLGVRETRYRVPGMDIEPDRDTLLLARFGFGFYFGDPDVRGGETLLYYDHRHDDYAAGLHLTGLGSGVPGHFGSATRLWLGQSFGIALEAEVGSAYLGGVSLMLRSEK